MEEFKHLERYTYILYVRNGVFGRSLQRAPENPLDDQIPMEEGCDGRRSQVQHPIYIRCHPTEGQNLWGRILHEATSLLMWEILHESMPECVLGFCALTLGTFLDPALPAEWEATSHRAGSPSHGLITGQRSSRAFRR